MGSLAQKNGSERALDRAAKLDRKRNETNGCKENYEKKNYKRKRTITLESDKLEDSFTVKAAKVREKWSTIHRLD